MDDGGTDDRLQGQRCPSAAKEKPAGRFRPTGSYLYLSQESFLCKWLVEFLLEKLPRSEVRLSASRDIDDLPGPWIPRRWLGTGLFHLEDAETPDFDPTALRKALAHGLKDSVYHA